MLNRNGLFRFVLTLLLALAMPFCCCDFRSLLTGCLSCDAAASGKAKLIAVQDGGRDHATHSHCHGHSRTSDDSDDHHGSAPGKAPDKDKHDCACGKNSGSMLTVAKSTLELPAPVLVVILDWSGLPGLHSLDLFKGFAVEKRVVERHQTSLLRMHCALIV